MSVKNVDNGSQKQPLKKEETNETVLMRSNPGYEQEIYYSPQQSMESEAIIAAQNNYASSRNFTYARGLNTLGYLEMRKMQFVF